MLMFDGVRRQVSRVGPSLRHDFEPGHRLTRCGTQLRARRTQATSNPNLSTLHMRS